VPTSDASPDPPGVSAASDDSPRSPRSIWWTARAIGLHVTLVVVVPSFLGLFWWQVQRVRQGNTLSWAYVFEWPFFTGYAVYLWWKLVHDQLDPAPGPIRVSPERGPQDGDLEEGLEEGKVAEACSPEGTPGADSENEEDEELAAYNRYLAELHASGRRKRW
jgi:hypothetical protein